MAPSALPTLANAATARSICAGVVRGAHLSSQARLALGHDGVRKADHVNAFFEERVRGARSEPGITEHNGNDRVVPRHQIEA